MDVAQEDLKSVDVRDGGEVEGGDWPGQQERDSAVQFVVFFFFFSVWMEDLWSLFCKEMLDRCTLSSGEQNNSGR